MKTWVQRIRGAVGIGLTWAAGWAPLGAITGWVTGTLLGFPIKGITVNYAVLFAVLAAGTLVVARGAQREALHSGDSGALHVGDSPLIGR